MPGPQVFGRQIENSAARGTVTTLWALHLAGPRNLCTVHHLFSCSASQEHNQALCPSLPPVLPHVLPTDPPSKHLLRDLATKLLQFRPVYNCQFRTFLRRFPVQLITYHVSSIVWRIKVLAYQAISNISTFPCLLPNPCCPCANLLSARR